MRILQTLGLMFGLSVFVNAQIDCSVTNKIFVRDYDGNVVKNAKLEIFKVGKNFSKVFAFIPQKVENDAHLITSFTGTIETNENENFYVSESYWLKVTAEDFKIGERPIKFDRCKSQEITVVLEQINQKIKLTGVVYDANGAVVVGAVARAADINGKIFRTATNDEGIYLLKLLPGTYRIEFEQPGFKKLVLEKYQVVNSTYGKLNQDVVFREVINPEPCGYSGADCLTSEPIKIENSKTEISDKILQISLEKLPKQQNKNKRKNN